MFHVKTVAAGIVENARGHAEVLRRAAELWDDVDSHVALKMRQIASHNDELALYLEEKLK